MESEPTPDRPEADAPQRPPTTTADQASQHRQRQADRPEVLSSKPASKLPGTLPPWKLLLHNDDVNDRRHVVECLISLAGLQEQDAVLRMHEAEVEGVLAGADDAQGKGGAASAAAGELQFDGDD